MAQVRRTLKRENGSEVQIVATEMFGAGLHRSVDVYVLHRASDTEPWKLASKDPHPDWLTMSVDDYIRYGRSEMLRLTGGPGEILKTTALLSGQ